MKITKDIPFVYVDRRSDFDRVVSEIEKEDVIGVDLEADSLFHYTEKICLIQISTDSRNILIDPLMIEDVSGLSQVFLNPKIRKIFHGADYDIRSLHRDYAIEVNGLFDTQIAATFLGLRETGLAGVIKSRFSKTIEKKYQKKDWSRRPLPDAMLKYAVQDSLFLLPLAEMLEQELKAKGLLFCVLEECERLQKVRVNPSSGQFFFLKHKGAGRLSPRSLTILEAVLQLRNDMARKLDRPAFKVMGNEQINRIVKEKPVVIDELGGKDGLSPKQIKRFGRFVLQKVNEAMMIPDDSLLFYPKKTMPKLGRKTIAHIKELKKWREYRSLDMGLDPAIICSNSQILSLAKACPKTEIDLKNIEDFRVWQQKLFGHEICILLNREPP